MTGAGSTDAARGSDAARLGASGFSEGADASTGTAITSCTCPGAGAAMASGTLDVAGFASDTGTSDFAESTDAEATCTGFTEEGSALHRAQDFAVGASSANPDALATMVRASSRAGTEVWFASAESYSSTEPSPRTSSRSPQEAMSRAETSTLALMPPDAASTTTIDDFVITANLSDESAATFDGPSGNGMVDAGVRDPPAKINNLAGDRVLTARNDSEAAMPLGTLDTPLISTGAPAWAGSMSVMLSEKLFTTANPPPGSATISSAPSPIFASPMMEKSLTRTSGTVRVDRTTQASTFPSDVIEPGDFPIDTRVMTFPVAVSIFRTSPDSGDVAYSVAPVASNTASRKQTSVVCSTSCARAAAANETTLKAICRIRRKFISLE